MQTPVTVVILAAGLGTRMKSRRAKVLHRAGGKTLVEHVVDTALAIAPPERVFVVVGHQAAEVRKAVTTPGVGFIEQAEQKGTGHAVMVGRAVLEGLGGNLVIFYGDGPLLRARTLQGLIAAQSAADSGGVLLAAEMSDPTGYGRVIRDFRGRAVEVVEQKAATPEQLAIREANMGIYCFRSELFWKHVGELRPDNPPQEYYLTDMVKILASAGHLMEVHRIDDPQEVMGINDRVELARVDRVFRERKVTELMLAGVTIEKPETVTIDKDVAIGMDSVIEPFAQILGRSTLGENCRVGACAIVQDSELADHVEIGAFTIVTESRLDRDVICGPFARVRPQSRVEPGAHIGNFVELKKTHLGAGAKANHLAYLGDSQIGAKVNIGAGTITCNYDGFAKHPTNIGEGAFVGSNSTLVAPSEIGQRAYVAAGSVITERVPPDALALGRSRQTVKEDWARKRRSLGKASPTA
jgi:bifunctional UDP-N-acetylglucosamine pyrophosphorylase / glucosamine-1-phosphate N-acetyltransferase